MKGRRSAVRRDVVQYPSLLSLMALAVSGCAGNESNGPDADVPAVLDDSVVVSDAGADVQATSDEAIVYSDADGPDIADAEPDGDFPGGLPHFFIELVESGSAGSPEWMAFASAGNAGYREEGGLIEVLRSGDCVLYDPKLAGFCDPPCEAPQFCTLDDVCGEHEVQIDAGKITVAGSKVGVEVVPETTRGSPYFYYTGYFDPDPVNGDIFDAGVELVATSDGDEYAPFSVSTHGVAQMATDLPCPDGATGDTDLLVSWAADSRGDTVRFMMRSGNHGGHFSQLICDTADTGELVVDKALIAAYRANWHPVESWRLERHSVGTTRGTDLAVTFRVSSVVGCMY